MYLLTIHKLVENFYKDEDGFSPEDWEYTTSIKLFETIDTCKEYLKQLKKEFHAKGKIATGVIKGNRVTKTTPHYKKKESINTSVQETQLEKEIEIGYECDVGEYPFGD